MQAIITKYLGPTNHHGARVKAICDAGMLTVPWDYGAGTPENHERAANALRRKLDDANGGGSIWSGRWAYGRLPTGDYAHVYRGEE